MKPNEQKKPMLPTEVLTPEFQVSYPYVFEARAAKPGDKAKFSIQMLFRVGSVDTSSQEKVVDIKPLRIAAKAAALEKWGHDMIKWPKNLHDPFRKGSEREGKAGYDAGIIFVSASSEFKPGVVDQNVEDIIDKNAFYPGCYARAKIVAYGWEYMGKAGISFGLRHVQLIRDGEPLGGGSRPEDDFDAIALPSQKAPPAAAHAPAGEDSLFGDLA